MRQLSFHTYAMSRGPDGCNENFPPDSLGQRVRAARLARQLTQMQLAARVGMGQPAISSLENDGSEWVRSTNILRLAQALDVSATWLETGEGEQEPPRAAGAPAEAMALEVFRGLDAGNRRAWIDAGLGILDRQRSPRAGPRAVEPRYPHFS